MTLTPRQLMAWLEFSDKLERIDHANRLMVTAVGSQGDKHSIEKTLKDLGS